MIDDLIAPPRSPVEEDDGPIVVMAPRPWSPPATVLPALLLLLVAGALMAYRAVGVEDWQGLFTESRDHLLARADLPGPALRNDQSTSDNDPAPELLPPLDVSSAEGTDPTPPAPEPSADPALPVEDSGPARDAAQDETIPADANAAVDPTEDALDEIRREAEHRRAEQEELARLKEKIEAEAPPPRRAPRGPDHAQMLAMIEALKRRQLEAMDQALRAMEQQQSEWFHRAMPGFNAFPEGLGDGDDPVFGPLRRRHAEAIERAERDMARFRERLGQGDPFHREPLAGAFPPPQPFPVPPPPAPGLVPEGGDGGMLPRGLVVPEGAEVRTFNGPDGSRGFIMRWGWPPR